MVPRKAVLLARISDARDGDTHGVDGQVADLIAYAARIGWQPGPRDTHVIVENDTSAFKRRKIAVPGHDRPVLRTVRPGYRRVLDMLHRGEADGFIAVDLDRTCRDPRDLEDLIDVVESRSPRIPVESRTGSLRLANDADVTMARVMVAVANKASRDTARRVAARREQKAAAGVYGGGKRPYGYGVPTGETDQKTGRLVLDMNKLVEAEAAEVRRWADLLLAGESMASILRSLRERCVPTVTGAAWSSRAVRDILRRPRNVGMAVYRGQEVGPAQWPAIMTEDVWRAVVALLDSDGRRTSPGNQPRWLGSLIFRCGVCDDGQTVYVGGGRSSHSKMPTYVCRSHGHLRRLASAVDDLVARVIIERLSRPDAVDLVAPRPGRNTAALASEANSLRARIEEAADLWESGALPAAAVKARTTRLRERLTAIEAELASTARSNPLAGLAGQPDVAERWPQLPLGQQRAILRTLMTVTLLRSRPGRQPNGGYFDPESVLIDWNDSPAG
jgi:DNA invertase Pin-like site-specific DNA recombinase